MTDMEQTRAELLEPLRIALQMEKEGKRLFLEAADRATGRHARKTFEFLAAEEDRHIGHILTFHASLEADLEGRLPELEPSNVVGRLREFNEQLSQLRDDMKPTNSDVEAFEFAIKFENGAEEFYRKQMETTNHDNVRAFYTWLIEEEGLHSRLLQSCLDFAADPAAWFSQNAPGQ